MTYTPSKALTEGFQVILADLRILWIFVGVGQGNRDEASLEGPEGAAVDASETCLRRFVRLALEKPLILPLIALA
jgi:hypothetical protein